MRPRLRTGIEVVGRTRHAIHGVNECGRNGDAPDFADALGDGEAVDCRAVGLRAVDDLGSEGSEVRVTSFGKGRACARDDAVRGAEGGEGPDTVGRCLFRGGNSFPGLGFAFLGLRDETGGDKELGVWARINR